jgi:hypothetical protein
MNTKLLEVKNLVIHRNPGTKSICGTFDTSKTSEILIENFTIRDM